MNYGEPQTVIYNADGSVSTRAFNKTSPVLNAHQRRKRNRRLLNQVLEGRTTKASKWGTLGFPLSFMEHLDEQPHQIKVEQVIKLLDLGRARGGQDTKQALALLTNAELNMVGVLTIGHVDPWQCSYHDMEERVVTFLMSTPMSASEPPVPESPEAGS